MQVAGGPWSNHLTDSAASPAAAWMALVHHLQGCISHAQLIPSLALSPVLLFFIRFHLHVKNLRNPS